MWGSYTASNPNLTIERYDRLRWRRNIIIMLIALGLFMVLLFAGLAIGYRSEFYLNANVCEVTKRWSTADQKPWVNYDLINDEFCEATRSKGFVSMPSNAWFSLPLLGAAGFVAYGGLHDLLLIESRANNIVSTPVVSLIHAIFSISKEKKKKICSNFLLCSSLRGVCYDIS